MSRPKNHSACPEREPDLQRYLFGQLEGGALDELGRHLEDCEGCSRALEEAAVGLSALRELEEPPLPFREAAPDPVEVIRAEEAWVAFMERVRSPGAVDQRHLFSYRTVAVAALLLVGVGIGRWLMPVLERAGTLRPQELPAVTVQIGVDPEAVDALVRAEFLADLAVPYVEGVLQLASGVMDLGTEEGLTGNIEALRSRARDLLQDGRLLRRHLEPDRDRDFLATLGRAEFFLEELVALGGDSDEAWNLNEIQETLQMTRLGDRLGALDMNGAVSEALEASGWIGEEYLQTREVRK